MTTTTALVFKKFYPVKKLPQELVQYFAYRHRTFIVPTELVIKAPYDPAMLLPKLGRIYDTNLVLHNGEIMLWDNVPYNCRAEGNYPTRIVLCEVWANAGDDGHISYQIEGFRLTSEDSCKEKEEYWGLPVPCEWDYDRDERY